MTDNVLVALIGAGQVLIVAVLATFGPMLVAKVRRVERDTKVVKNEVKNDHKTNLREEQDARHRENTRTLSVIRKLLGRGMITLEGVQEDIRQHTNDLKLLRDYALENRDRIEDLEDTRPTREEKAP